MLRLFSASLSASPSLSTSLISSTSVPSTYFFRSVRSSTASILPKKVRCTPTELHHHFKELLKEKDKKILTGENVVKPLHWPDIEERLRSRNEEHKIPQFREIWTKFQNEQFRLQNQNPNKKWDWLYLEKEIFPAKPDNPPPYEQLGFLPDDEDVPERVPFPVEAEELAEPDEIMKHDSVIAKLPLLPPVRTPQINADGTTAAVGRRKTAVVTAILKPGTGSIVVNRKPFVEYFPEIQWRETILQPFLLTERLGVYDVYLRAAGGGKGSQAESARMAISRALVLRDPSHRLILKYEGLLTRDPRAVERKKPGQKKARKKFQWGKR